jgi:hypothetical protein
MSHLEDIVKSCFWGPSEDKGPQQGPKPLARPSCLLMDPRDICPPQAPNLWVDFEIISPKILDPARMFIMWRGFHSANGCTKSAPVVCSSWTSNGFLRIIHSKVFILCFGNQYFIVILCFGNQHFVIILCFRNQRFVFLGLKIYWVHRRSPWALSRFLKIIHSKVFILCCRNQHSVLILCFRDQHSVFLGLKISPNGYSPRDLSRFLKIIHSNVFILCFKNQHYVITYALEISILSSSHVLANSNNVICPCLVRSEIYLISDRLDVWQMALG